MDTDGHSVSSAANSTPLNKKYSTFDRELLAVHSAIRHFRHMLEGTSYTICTDHKLLVTALKTSDAWTSRQQRHLSTIAETCCTIEYLPGKQNAVADALSRVEILTIQLGVNYEALSAAQLTDPETEDAKTSITNLRWCCGHLFISTMSTQLFVMLLDILSDRGRFTHLLSPSNIMSYHRSKSVHTNLDTFYCLHEFEVFRDL